LTNTVRLATATTAATLPPSRLFPQRRCFAGRAVPIAMMTFPLAFPGVVVGFISFCWPGARAALRTRYKWIPEIWYLANAARQSVGATENGLR
jgi:putative spermidine/putrescine transport system permease protein